MLLRADAGLCLCFLRLNRKAPVQRIRSARRRITNAGQTGHESREQSQIFFLSWKGRISTLKIKRAAKNAVYFLLVCRLQISWRLNAAAVKGNIKSVKAREREREGKKERETEERDTQRERGGGERPQGALFYQQCQLLFMRASEPRMVNGTRLFMRLCANAPASLIQGGFFPALA